MSESTLKFLAIALTLSTMAMAPAKADDETLRQLSDYRGWTRLTGQPLPIAITSLGG
ncbi:MAG TPA: hypothetical protein VKD91_07325 [Pyrinomonadaceae bacterium]|nr:hypothetical protein [Pyrinomonadaceae bacterium]